MTRRMKAIHIAPTSVNGTAENGYKASGGTNYPRYMNAELHALIDRGLLTAGVPSATLASQWREEHA